MKQEIWDKIGRLGRDREHGAAQLFKMTASILMDALSQDASSEYIGYVACEVLKAQPSMAPLINLCNKLLLLVDEGKTQDALELLGEVINSKVDYQAAAKPLASHLERVDRLVLFSYSSTVLGVLLSLGPRLPVITHIGYPIRDGEKSAKLLIENGFDVILTADLCLPGMLEAGDLVITGCDAVTPKALVNRSGTYSLALAARERGIEFVVVTEQSKFLHCPLDRCLRFDFAPAEELETNCERCVVRHRYFEDTPLRLISKVITPEGVMGSEELMGVLEEPVRVAPSLMAVFDMQSAEL